MTRRTPGDIERRRNLADASITPLPALAGWLRNFPSQRREADALALLNAPAAEHDGASQIGTER